MATSPEPRHASTELPDPLHVSADLSEPHPVIIAMPVSSEKMAATLEPTPAFWVMPKSSAIMDATSMIPGVMSAACEDFNPGDWLPVWRTHH